MKKNLIQTTMASFLFVAVFSASQLAWSLERQTPNALPRDEVFPHLPSDFEKSGGFCEIINDTDNPAYFYDSLIQGSGFAVYMNPEYCGPSPYPFRITDVHFYLYAHDETYRWPVALTVNIRDAHEGDSCAGPGQIICSEEISVPVDSAYPVMLTYNLSSPYCVDQPFFLEIIYTDPFDPDHRNPSPLMDTETEPSDTCDNWVRWDGEYWSWHDFWPPSPWTPGDAIIRATGYTESFQRGDANGDGVINVADIVYLVNFLYRGGDPPDPMVAGDANSDDIVNVADVVYLVNYLYRGGDPPGC